MKRAALVLALIVVAATPCRAGDLDALDVDGLVQRMSASWRWRTLPTPPIDAPSRVTVDDDGTLVLVGARSLATFDGYTWSERPRPEDIAPYPPRAAATHMHEVGRRELLLPLAVRAPVLVVEGDDVRAISSALRFLEIVEVNDDLLVGVRDDGLFTAVDAERAPSFEAVAGRTPFSSICLLPTGHLVVLRPTRDVLVCDLASECWRTHDPTVVGLSPIVTAIEPARRGGHWVATHDGVAHLAADGAFSDAFGEVTTDDGATVELRTVTALHEEPDGTLWIGSGASFGGALARRSDGSAVLHRDADTLGPHRVHAIHALGDDDLWFCLLNRQGVNDVERGGGLARRHAGRWSRWTVDDGLPHGRVYDVVRRANGRIYAATREGVATYDETRDAWRAVDLPDLSPVDAHVRDLVDRPDGLWGVTHAKNGGPFRAALGDDPTRVASLERWTVPYAEALAFDDAGVPWITSRRALWQLQDGRPHATSQADGISGALWPIVPSDGRLLIGGSQRGLLSFRDDYGSPPRVLDAVDRWDTERDELRVDVVARDAWERTPASAIQVSWRRPGGEWSALRPSGEAIVFGDLPIGSSTIEIRAYDASGLASEQDFALNVVRPAPWSRRSSTWLLIVSVVAAAASYARERREHIAERREARRALLEVQEDERRAISREIHDDLGQLLNAAMIELSRARRLEGPRHAEAVTEARAICRAAIDRSRSLSLVLRPRTLDELGLRHALEQELSDLARRSRLAVDSHLDDLPEHLPDDVAVQIYRIASEALTNIARHADGARRVEVAVRSTPRRLELSIRDDGRGFDVALLEGSRRLGVLGMRERAQILGGRLDLETSPSTGTCVRLSVPRAQFDA